MRKFLDEWLSDVRRHKTKIALAILFLTLAAVATVVAGNYVDETRTVVVPDLILDNIPTIDLSFLFLWGGVLVVAVFVLYPLMFEPRKFHYALGMLSLFILVRAAFMILTHMKAPATAITVNAPGFLQIFTYSNDLFFSGHSGLPFLGFLVFRKSPVRYFMLLSSIVLALTVLLMHVHYSIDVASAYFITYGIYMLGQPLFDGEDSGNPNTVKR